MYVLAFNASAFFKFNDKKSFHFGTAFFILQDLRNFMVRRLLERSIFWKWTFLTRNTDRLISTLRKFNFDDISQNRTVLLSLAFYTASSTGLASEHIHRCTQLNIRCTVVSK